MIPRLTDVQLDSVTSSMPPFLDYWKPNTYSSRCQAILTKSLHLPQPLRSVDCAQPASGRNRPGM